MTAPIARRPVSEDPLIFAISQGGSIGIDALNAAIAFRRALREQLEHEIYVIEEARERAIEGVYV